MNECRGGIGCSQVFFDEFTQVRLMARQWFRGNTPHLIHHNLLMDCSHFLLMTEKLSFNHGIKPFLICWMAANRYGNN